MDLKRKREQGLTLAELLIATLLMSVVFVGVTAAYISALKLFQRMQLNAGTGGTLSTKSTNDQFIALEHVVRRARLANSVVLGEPGNLFDAAVPTKTYQQAKFRLDYNSATLTPNNSPVGTTSDTSDDQWVKYRFVQVTPGVWKLLWRTDATVTTDVSGTDPEVQPNLKITSSSSYFKTEAVTAPGTPPGAVSISLTTQVGDPPRTFSLVTVAWSHIKTDAA